MVYYYALSDLDTATTNNAYDYTLSDRHPTTNNAYDYALADLDTTAANNAYDYALADLDYCAV